MRTIPAGRFKQTCLRLIDEVGVSREPIVITKRGKPVAQLAPLPASERPDWFGSMRGRGRILGDIMAPAADLDEWDALRD